MVYVPAVILAPESIAAAAGMPMRATRLDNALAGYHGHIKAILRIMPRMEIVNLVKSREPT